MRPPLRGGRGGGGGFRGGGGGRGGGFGGRGGGGFGGRGGGGYRDEGPPEEVVGEPKIPHCCDPSAPYVKVYGREFAIILYVWMIAHISFSVELVSRIYGCLYVSLRSLLCL